ncbi:DUF2147 domain-containing protein [Defluviimonas sp. WL0024]|uniref:DUF2147 domain-containing protein n=2 Tax=Albidovulum TaxID=205889 RepID=A0ABT3JAM2_9RHOB|nr:MULTISPECIES: DUF2147 domain-containing protein [Defluviimonas]MCU9847583.1 DUF2147 domain-containing protein [Defluviimonas sp. WL0024]MCW3784495.1 DUF2147 domain-containing protein [Defluviimonas salinarum]
MRIRGILFAVGVGACLGTAALADPILGTWQVEPDHKGQIGLVVIRRCGEAFCGRVMQVFDRAGKSVVTRSMGRDLFWDLKPNGNGTYFGGRVWVPLHDKVYDAKARLKGDQLIVRGCVGPVCDGQTWNRIY